MSALDTDATRPPVVEGAMDATYGCIARSITGRILQLLDPAPPTSAPDQPPLFAPVVQSALALHPDTTTASLLEASQALAAAPLTSRIALTATAAELLRRGCMSEAKGLLDCAKRQLMALAPLSCDDAGETVRLLILSGMPEHAAEILRAIPDTGKDARWTVMARSARQNGATSLPEPERAWPPIALLSAHMELIDAHTSAAPWDDLMQQLERDACTPQRDEELKQWVIHNAAAAIACAEQLLAHWHRTRIRHTGLILKLATALCHAPVADPHTEIRRGVVLLRAGLYTEGLDALAACGAPASTAPGLLLRAFFGTGSFAAALDTLESVPEPAQSRMALPMALCAYITGRMPDMDALRRHLLLALPLPGLVPVAALFLLDFPDLIDSIAPALPQDYPTSLAAIMQQAIHAQPMSSHAVSQRVDTAFDEIESIEARIIPPSDALRLLLKERLTTSRHNVGELARRLASRAEARP